MSEVATAFVSILPSAKGFGGKLSKEVGGDLDTAGREGGKKYSNGMAGAVGGMATKIFAPLAAAAGGIALGSFFTGSLSAASELQQSVGAVDTVFGDSAGQIHDWAASAAQSVGLAKNEYNNLGTLIATQLKNGGTAMDELAPKTNDLIGLGADLSSMFGGSAAEAVGALSSALKGERDPIERYGVSLTQAAVDAKAAELGFEKVGGALSTEASQAATLALIMDQTADAHGNFAKESNTVAGQQQRLQAQFENVKTTLGTALLPALSGVMGFVSASLMPAFESLIGFITGSAIPGLQSFAQWVSQNAVPIGIVAALITAVFLPALVSMGVTATINGAKVVASWVATQAAAIAGAAAQSAAVVRTVAGWVLMGVQSLLQAARMAAAWVIAMGPVGWVIAAVVGLTALIIANWDKVAGFTRKAWTAVSAWLSSVWQSISATAGRVWNGVLDFFRAIPGKILAFFLNWTLPGLLIKHWDSIKEGAVNGFTAVVDFIKGVPGKIVSALGSVGSMLYDSGKAIIQGLIDGIGDMVGSVTNAVGNVLSAARDLLPFSPAKKGPFSGKGWTLYSGRSISEALADGIGDNRDLVVSATRSVVDAASMSGLSAPSLRANVSAVGAGADGNTATGGIVNNFNGPISTRDEDALARRLVTRQRDALSTYGLTVATV